MDNDYERCADQCELQADNVAAITNPGDTDIEDLISDAEDFLRIAAEKARERANEER